jgi:hypothetical protein
MSVTINEKMFVYLKANLANPSPDLASNLSRYLAADTATPPNRTARWIALMVAAKNS